MKKLIKNLLSLMLACLLFVGGIQFSTNRKAEASGSTTIPYNSNSYMSQYFYDLSQNFPRNYYGTCGYVAISMLLSYYDNYLDGNIIPSNYEAISQNATSMIRGTKNSPGVTYNNDPKANPVEYYTYMYGKSSTYIQARLFDFGKTFLALPYIAGNATEYSGGLTWFQLVNIMASYLRSVDYSSVSDESAILENGEYRIHVIRAFEYAWAERNRRTKEFVVQQIDLGRPVLLFITKDADEEIGGGNNGGHFVIAYDYSIDPSTNEKTVYCHSGWEYTYNHHVTVEDMGYSYWYAALALEIQNTHQCDDNYRVGNNTYCYHDSAITTYTHTHNYNYSGAQYVIAGNYHTIKCETCFENANISHSYGHSYQQYSETLHKSKCICGGYVLTAHVVSNNGNLRFKPCLACGYLVDTLEDFGGTLHPGSINQLVTVNGSYVLSNGVIVLVDEDVEAYFAGTLKFYKKDELPENI